VSFAEELHQHLNTFKSFVFRSTSVHLLGSRCGYAVAQLASPSPNLLMLKIASTHLAWLPELFL
jgi:hypothetical protein